LRTPRLVLVCAIGVSLMVGWPCGAAPGRQAAAAAPSGGTKSGADSVPTKRVPADGDAGAEPSLKETLSFRFAILNLMTNHQFNGQLNSFHVEYEYAGSLEGGGFDPQGHAVAANTFPYFQSVRNDIIQFATEYKDKNNFYELFGEDICRFVLRKYPQIRKITLTIDIPAYKEVDLDRGATIVMVRGATKAKR
jgi:hypothetical protein